MGASSRGTCSRSGSGRSSSCSSTCTSGGCSNGSSCVCIFDLISFQGFHSFLLMCFINKQTNESFLQHARISKAFQSYLLKQHLSAAVLCFPTSFKFQRPSIKI